MVVNTITLDHFTKRLNLLFCKENKANKKYEKVWLSDVDFGGLYHNDKYVVHVKAEHQIESCNVEIKYIYENLFTQLSPDDLYYIWRLVVYNADEQVHCYSEDIPVYSLQEAC